MAKPQIPNTQLKAVINAQPSYLHTSTEQNRMAIKAFSLLIRQNPTIKDLKEIAQNCRFELIARDAGFIISIN